MLELVPANDIVDAIRELTTGFRFVECGLVWIGLVHGVKQEDIVPLDFHMCVELIMVVNNLLKPTHIKKP